MNGALSYEALVIIGRSSYEALVTICIQTHIQEEESCFTKTYKKPKCLNLKCYQKGNKFYCTVMKS